MNTWIKGFYMVLCLSVLLSVHVWADEPLPATDQPSTPQNGPAPPQPPAPVQPPAPTQPNEPVRNVFESGLAPVASPTAASSDQPVEIQTNLEGLSIGARGSRAVINGEVYKEGEEKLGIKVLQVRKKEVDILINQAVKRTLSMLPGETRDIPMTPEESANPSLEEGKGADTVTVKDEAQNKEPVYV